MKLLITLGSKLNNMFAVYTLFSSFLLIVLLFLFKHWELASGRALLGEYRQRADIFISEHIPRLYQRAVKAGKDLSHKAAMSCLHFITASLLRLVRAIEWRLSHTVDMIRGRRKVMRQGSASSFLMQVSEHKKVNGNKPNRLSKDVQ